MRKSKIIKPTPSISFIPPPPHNSVKPFESNIIADYIIELCIKRSFNFMYSQAIDQKTHQHAIEKSISYCKQIAKLKIYQNDFSENEHTKKAVIQSIEPIAQNIDVCSRGNLILKNQELRKIKIIDAIINENEPKSTKKLKSICSYTPRMLLNQKANSPNKKPVFCDIRNALLLE